MSYFPVDSHSNERLRSLAVKKLLEDEEVVAVADDPREDVDDWFSVLYAHHENGDVVAVAFFPERLRATPYDAWDALLAEVTIDVLAHPDGYRLPPSWYGNARASA